MAGPISLENYTNSLNKALETDDPTTDLNKIFLSEAGKIYQDKSIPEEERFVLIRQMKQQRDDLKPVAREKEREVAHNTKVRQAKNRLVADMDKIEAMPNLDASAKQFLKAQKVQSVAEGFDLDPNLLVPQAPQSSSEAPVGGEQQIPYGRPIPSSEAILQPSVNVPDYGLGTIQKQIQQQQQNIQGQLPQLQAGQQQIFTEQQQQIENAKNLARERAESEQAYIDKQQALQTKQQAQNQLLENARQQKMRPIIDSLNNLTNDLNTAKIDPDHFWKDKSVPQKVGLIIGIALMNADNRSGMQYLSSAIDRDIQSQKDEIEGKRIQSQIIRNNLADMRTVFSDERAAEAAARAMQWQTAEIELNKLRAKAKNQEQIQQLDQMGLQIRQQAEQYKQQAIMTENQLVTGALQQQAGIAAQRQTAAIQKQQLQLQKMAAEAKGQGIDLNKLQVVGTKLSGERLPTEKDAEVAGKLRTSGVNTLDKISNIERFLDEHGSEYTSIFIPGFESQVTKVARSLANDLQLELKNIKGLGVLSATDIQMLDALVPADLTGFWQSDIRAVLGELRNLITTQLNTGLRQLGYQEQEYTNPQTIGFEQ